jgi:uncharacterized circularly permuted ATP-grasp superfamily protein/uncharacterized alpha-E superfamily protein
MGDDARTMVEPPNDAGASMTTKTAEAIPAGLRGLAESYVPRSAEMDEMLEPDGSLRPHWRPFVNVMDDMGREEILARSNQARRMVRENGVTHNVYGDTGGLARPWSLDVLPLLLSGAEWAGLEASLAQRGRLLNALVKDIYGAGTSVASGVLPPELVFGNPWFLRPAHGVTPPLDCWLHLYAADLIRSSGGQFQVISDRTQAPSGTGYSLENRIVISRVLPSAFRQCNVLRLAPFFISMRKMLTSLAPANRENPRVVLLTPGPFNETYFEHAYLARYLGYTLVQGNDLTVRDCRVYLKTLSGLQRVDVILRRVDDDFCDPLELYAGSFLGIPGLLQAIREKTVAIANAIGTGVLQAPAFLPFLPALCRHLLGEDLQLKSVPTWWCGNGDSRKYVLENLSKLVIKAAMPLKYSNPIFCSGLSSGALSELAAKIEAKPTEYLAQENVSSFSAPLLVDEEVISRRFVLRAFLSASNGSYTAMPGGLTRISKSADALIVSIQSGAGSKDTWIVCEGPVDDVSLLTPAGQPLELSRDGGDLTSRVADDLFWLGRYTQRAESVVRLARTLFTRLLDPTSDEGLQASERLIRPLIGWTPKMDAGIAQQVAVELFTKSDPSGLMSSISNVHSLARVLRDRISVDAWQILREVDREFPAIDSAIRDERIGDVLELLSRLVHGYLAFGGMSADSMTRGLGWRFLDMGMRIERALALTRLIRATLVQVSKDELPVLDALLDIADSSLTYRRRYFTRLETTAVLDLLLADETNPRAIAFQIAGLEENLAHLPRDSSHPQKGPDLQLVIKLRSMVRLTNMAAICQPTNGVRMQLDNMLTEIHNSLGRISELMGEIYFSHAVASSPVSGGTLEHAS